MPFSLMESAMIKSDKLLQITAVAVAQLPFLENSFQKHKILTSLEAILERFGF